MAALVVGAVAVGSASAALPEFKTTGSFPVTFTSVSALPLGPTFKTLAIEVKCKMATVKGEVGGAKLVSKVVFTYTECTTILAGIGTVGCKSAGQTGNTIVTLPTMAELGYINKAIPTVGLLFHPEAAGTTVIVEFPCSIITVRVIGNVIGLASPLNSLQTTGRVEFTPAQMGQVEKNLEGGPTDKLELLGEEVSIMDTEEETFSSAVELKA